MADRLLDLNRGPTSWPWTEDLRAVQRQINDGLLADPALADRFAEQMQSGDPIQVDEAFTSLAGIVRRVLDDRYGPDAVDRAIFDLDRKFVDEKLIRIALLHNEFAFDTGHETWYALDAYVAAEAVVVALVAVALAALAVKMVVIPGDFSAKAQLAHEILIQKIAGGLRMGY